MAQGCDILLKVTSERGTSQTAGVYIGLARIFRAYGKWTGFLMTNLNDFTANRNAKAVLGSMCSVEITSTYNLYGKKRRLGVLNCGTAKCGESGDVRVFVLGLEQPQKSFTGQIVAIASDASGAGNDVWIAAPENSVYYEPRLAALLSKYLPPDSYRYICYYEKSCGAVMFTGSGADKRYLLIKNISGHIGFPKGHIEAGENEKQTALREIYEETGVHARLFDGFRESYNYLINGFIRKKAVYYLARFDEADVKMNIREISEYKALSYDEAMKALNFKHDRDILEKADKYIDEMNL